jgi:hypothetical protein
VPVHPEIEKVRWWRRWESNPTVGDTPTPRGHSVFPRIAFEGMQSDLLFQDPAVPWNAPACPALWSLSGHSVQLESQAGARFHACVGAETRLEYNVRI